MINAYRNANNNFSSPKNVKINIQKNSPEKIETINQAMKIYHAKQDILLDLDNSARKKLAIMAKIMIKQNNYDTDI